MIIGQRYEVSVIIPTYNRVRSLQDTLKSLAEQTLAASRFEVIVVDDGSTEKVENRFLDGFPFVLHYIYQDNQGDAEARNTGAQNSSADLLVFLDDDVIVGKDYLAAIVEAHEDSTNKIVVGTQILWIEEGNPPTGGSEIPGYQLGDQSLTKIKFSDVCSNNMSIRRESYHSIGLMESLNFSGSSMWCDVDFSYRAYLKGFGFYLSNKAVCWHRDYVLENFENQKTRWREAAYRAVTLFEKYPQLSQEIPMFVDKTPIDLRFDSLELVLRKLARQLTSSQLFMWVLEILEGFLSERNIFDGFTRHLQRWIIGGYIYRGYRSGLQEKSGRMQNPIVVSPANK
jgi:glycosyltransferase involved in cell wall biosynthesis